MRSPDTDHLEECLSVISGLTCSECECWCHLPPADRQVAWEAWVRMQDLLAMLEQRGALDKQ